MNEKTYYIVCPPDDAGNLCEDFLEEVSFHERLTITDSDEKKVSLPAWEVSLATLRLIHRAAVDKYFPMKKFRVAVKRSRHQETVRWAQKDEYIEGYQSRNKRPENLERIQRERRDGY